MELLNYHIYINRGEIGIKEAFEGRCFKLGCCPCLALRRLVTTLMCLVVHFLALKCLSIEACSPSPCWDLGLVHAMLVVVVVVVVARLRIPCSPASPNPSASSIGAALEQ